MSRKISESGVKNRPCLSDAGAVLNFLGSFLDSSQKMKWVFRGKVPINQCIIKTGNVTNCHHLNIKLQANFLSMGANFSKVLNF
jgi:hypothetical protein